MAFQHQLTADELDSTNHAAPTIQTAWARLPILTSLAALLLTCAVFMWGFLHEDAYILYIYSRNLIDIGQIAFDTLHGPAEGATDFLWMALISAFYGLHLDPGFGAALLNACGAGMLARAFATALPERPSIAGLGLIGALVIVSPMMGAAVGGFSSLFYAGLYATVLSHLVRREPVPAIWWTLALCLTRPDGVILSLGTMGWLLWQHWRSRQVLLHLAAITLIGAGYFAWRYSYFGEWLPLPLMVKSKGDGSLDGLGDNVRALWPMLPALLLALVCTPARQRRTLWICLLPAALLFAALSFAHQSQNISFRFQGPIYVSILMAALMCRLPRPALYALAFIPFLLLGARNVAQELRYLTRPSYVNTFPAELKAELGPHRHLRMAVTEAGRFPYYFPGPYIDLVGLNSRDIAKSGLSLEQITAFAPDLLFVHHAETYAVPTTSSRNYLVMDRATFLNQVYRSHRSNNPVGTAPSLAGQYVATQARFDKVYLVKYGNGLHHVYFVDSSKITPTQFEHALERSFADHKLTHCRSSHQLPCRLM